LPESDDGQSLQGCGGRWNDDELPGVRVTAACGFDPATWQSTGIGYAVEISSDASADQLARLLEAVDQAAEIPRAIRSRGHRPSDQLSCIRCRPGRSVVNDDCPGSLLDQQSASETAIFDLGAS
jgi:hypothetical protein